MIAFSDTKIIQSNAQRHARPDAHVWQPMNRIPDNTLTRWPRAHKLRTERQKWTSY